ncbi:MAG: 50S ribosomal protein L37ae [Candidatus Micrarchaeota archaeon]
MRTPKYGAKLRKLYNSVDKAKNTKYICPKCSKTNVKRISNAIWLCNSCNAKMSGGAYTLTTGIGEVANRIIKEYSKK